MSEAQQLAGRTILVTGAGGGLGSAMSEVLLERGAAVLLTDKAPTDEFSVLTERLGAPAFTADLTDRGTIIDLISWADGHGVDGLVNNAGIVSMSKLVDFPDEDWDLVVETNLSSVHLMTKHFAQRLTAAERPGSVVNIASMSYKGMTRQAAYVASKGGVVSHTKAAAMELARHDIRVNAIAPGMIETDMTNPDDGAQDSLRQSMTKQIPMRRYGRPAEIASVAAFLLSEDAAYLTGEVLHVSGGARL